MADLTPYLPRLKATLSNYCSDPQAAFLAALLAAGFAAPKSLITGRIDRIDGPGDKRGKKSGWYVYHSFPSDSGDEIIGIAHYGDWKTGDSQTWCSRSDSSMTHEERNKFMESRERLREQHRSEEIQRHAETASKAVNIIQSAADCAFHPYLTKKGIKTVPGLKTGVDGRLIVPIEIDGKIASLQMIDASGEKRFLTGGKIKSGHFRIAGNENVIYVAEGLATGISLYEATGASVYISFNAGNLYEVASVAKAREKGTIIIAGDDDSASPGNVGRAKAEQAGAAFSCDVIFPEGYNDFNDMHSGLGIEALSKYLSPKKNKKTAKSPAQSPAIAPPPGILSDIVAYYNATSGNAQPGFAVQTALAIGSVVLGRSYRTSFDNFPSLFLINVGKSSTGKEHSKTVIEKILNESGRGGLISGDGYTSGGGVFTALLDKPKHISVIDEFGRYLEAGANLAKGNINQREANTKLMESIGRAHSVMRPPSYSAMTLKKDAADSIKNRIVYNPAITLLGMTTPSTLFKTLDMGAIKDGFINRFLISISDAERRVRKHKQPIAVPERIIEWIIATDERHGKPQLAIEPATPVVLEFSEDAIHAQEEFQKYCIDMANSLEKFGMEELPGRSNEMAMRVALICAVSRDVNAAVIEKSDMDWSIEYIKSLLEKTIAALKLSISGSEFEAVKKEILADLRERGEAGITWSAMQKNAPYSKHKPKDLREIMAALRDAELAIDESGYVGEKGGRPTVRWMAG